MPLHSYSKYGTTYTPGKYTGLHCSQLKSTTKEVKNPIRINISKWNMAKINASEMTVALSRTSPVNITVGNTLIIRAKEAHITVLRKIKAE